MHQTLMTLLLMTLLLVQPGCSLSSSSSSSNNNNNSVRFLPTEIEFRHVSKQYPLTWQRRFLSSVPIREYALEDIHFVLEPHQLVLIRGASSSGKSTLLQVIHQPDQVTSGSVHICCEGTASGQHEPAITPPPRPIYLDQRPPVENRRTIGQVLSLDTATQQRSRGDDAQLSQHVALVRELATCLEFCSSEIDDDNENESLSSSFTTWIQRPASQLSPSETYRLALLHACLDSCSGTTPGNNVVVLPAPVLLLDEWLDKETSTVIQAVQQSLVNLVVSTGAIVCVVTHTPDRWMASAINRTLTLRSGKIV